MLLHCWALLKNLWFMIITLAIAILSCTASCAFCIAISFAFHTLVASVCILNLLSGLNLCSLPSTFGHSLFFKSTSFYDPSIVSIIEFGFSCFDFQWKWSLSFIVPCYYSIIFWSVIHDSNDMLHIQMCTGLRFCFWLFFSTKPTSAINIGFIPSWSAITRSSPINIDTLILHLVIMLLSAGCNPDILLNQQGSCPPVLPTLGHKEHEYELPIPKSLKPIGYKVPVLCSSFSVVWFFFSSSLLMFSFVLLLSTLDELLISAMV